MRALNDCHLYGILDTGYCEPDAMPGMLERMIEGGVDIVQLRAKDLPPDRIAELARLLLPISQAAEIPFVINDFPEIAGETGAEGVHVGVEDMTAVEARRRSGGKCFVGKSSHSVPQALEGAGQGADYLGFGPLFPTKTKPDYTAIGTAEIREVYRLVKIPVFCIGGIKRENLPGVIEAGARRAVIVSGLLQADDPARYVRECRGMLVSA